MFQQIMLYTNYTTNAFFVLLLIIKKSSFIKATRTFGLLQNVLKFGSYLLCSLEYWQMPFFSCVQKNAKIAVVSHNLVPTALSLHYGYRRPLFSLTTLEKAQQNTQIPEK